MSTDDEHSGGINRPPPPLDPVPRAVPPDTSLTWRTCPECGIGSDQDHKRGCSRGKWRNSPRSTLRPDEDRVQALRDGEKK